jgi:RNA polymerase sigma factor (sigma-70 family)
LSRPKQEIRSDAMKISSHAPRGFRGRLRVMRVKAPAYVAGTQRRFRTRSIEDHLADLYASHSRAAIRLAFLLTGDRDTAEDICHEAFARVGGRLGGLRDPERASGYLFRTVVNLSRSHGRGLRRDKHLKERLHDPSVNQFPDIAVRDELVQALMRLPLRQRAAVFFRYYEDLSEGEVADVLNCSVDAARSLTFRAMEKLRKNLQEVDK